MLFSMLAATLFAGLSWAGDSCPIPIRSAQSILECVDQLSPEVRRAELDLQRSRLQEAAAGQWKNPELGMNSVSGKVDGSKSAETDISLGVPIELGGKVGARRNVSRGRTAAAEAELYLVRAKNRVSALLNLHRYRQALHELAVVQESIRSFSTLNSQYASRAKLSPEQETSASVYRMAKSQYELKRAELNDELAEIATFFRVNALVAEDVLRGVLPPSPVAWPIIPTKGTTGSSPRARAAEAEVRTAEAELGVARSEAWPTVSVGPSVKLQKDGAAKGNLWGFNVGLSVPLFNVNGAAKEAASAGLRTTEAVRELVRLGEENVRVQAERVYRQSVGLLSSTLSHQEVERAHHEVERLFSRGIVPSALVIEAHRSYLDLEKSRNDRERKALSTLLEIYTIDGRVMEEIQ